MADLVRQRKNPAYGMPGADGIADIATRRIVADLQQRITELSAQVNAKAHPAAEDNRVEVWAKSEIARLNGLVKELSRTDKTLADRADTLARTLKAMHAYTISNTLGETIPAYSVMRITAYDPDTNLITAGKPLGWPLDIPEKLLFTGHFDIEDKSLGVAYSAADTMVKAAYTTADPAFVPSTGTIYQTVEDTWTLIPCTTAIGGVVMGIGANAADYDTASGTVYVRSFQQPGGTVQLYVPGTGVVTAHTLRFAGRLRGTMGSGCLALSAAEA